MVVILPAEEELFRILHHGRISNYREIEAALTRFSSFSTFASLGYLYFTFFFLNGQRKPICRCNKPKYLLPDLLVPLI